MDELYCRHFLLCHTIWQNAGNDDAPFSLGRVIVNVRPPAGDGYPFQFPRLFAYGELYGDMNDYTVQVRQVLIDTDDMGEEIERPVKAYLWIDRPVTGLDMVEPFSVDLLDVPFPIPGIYEFQLWADGFDEPLAQVRAEARR